MCPVFTGLSSKRINFPAVTTSGLLRGTYPRPQARAELVGEKLFVFLRTEFGLTVHVRKQLNGRPARSLAPETGDAHHHRQRRTKLKGSSALFLHHFDLLLPADSSSLRVSVSELFRVSRLNHDEEFV